MPLFERRGFRGEHRYICKILCPLIGRSGGESSFTLKTGLAEVCPRAEGRAGENGVVTEDRAVERCGATEGRAVERCGTTEGRAHECGTLTEGRAGEVGQGTEGRAVK